MKGEKVKANLYQTRQERGGRAQEFNQENINSPNGQLEK